MLSIQIHLHISVLNIKTI